MTGGRVILSNDHIRTSLHPFILSRAVVLPQKGGGRESKDAKACPPEEGIQATRFVRHVPVATPVAAAWRQPHRASSSGQP